MLLITGRPGGVVVVDRTGKDCGGVLCGGGVRLACDKMWFKTMKTFYRPYCTRARAVKNQNKQTLHASLRR